jgi:NADH:ubiquinone oxidoreductase subunit D
MDVICNAGLSINPERIKGTAKYKRVYLEVFRDEDDLKQNEEKAAEMESFPNGRVNVIVHYKKAGTGVLVLTDGQGNPHRIRLDLDEEKNLHEKLID